MQKVKLYYKNKSLEIVSIILDNVKHFTCDIRRNPTQLICVFSQKTIECKLFNDEFLQELIDKNQLELLEIDIDVEVVKEIYTYYYIHSKYFTLN